MDYDFSTIPEFNDTPESFDITSDKVSGRIPVTRLEHWRELPDLLSSKFFNQEGVEPIFRGHRRYDWALMPTLARASENEMISKELADQQLRKFKQAIRGRIQDHALVEDNFDQENELWAVGQHHGLMTPLLDWTYSPYVALFFAFSKEDIKEEKDNDYRAIYILNKSFIEDEELCTNIPVVEPKKDDHGRLVNQAGLFTFSPYDSTIENTLVDILADESFPDDELKEATESEQAGILAKYICKVYIKNTDRSSCVKHLRQMNVHHASLFPDLIGAAEFCNVLVSEKHQADQQRNAGETTTLLEESPSSKGDLTTANLEFLDYGRNIEDFERETPAVAESSAKYTVTNNTIELFDYLDIEKNSLDSEMISRLINQYAPEVIPENNQRMSMLIGEKLALDLTVDWEVRDSVQARARNDIRAILRKYDFPLKNRNEFIDALFDQLLNEDTV